MHAGLAVRIGTHSEFVFGCHFVAARLFSFVQGPLGIILSDDNCISLPNVHHPRIIIVESHFVGLSSSLNDRTVAQCNAAINFRALFGTVIELCIFVFGVSNSGYKVYRFISLAKTRTSAFSEPLEVASSLSIVSPCTARTASCPPRGTLQEAQPGVT